MSARQRKPADQENVEVQDDLSVQLSRGGQVLVPDLVEEGTIQSFDRPPRVECPNCRATRFKNDQTFEIGPDGLIVVDQDLVCVGCGRAYKREELIAR
jgi:hypothetical protein